MSSEENKAIVRGMIEEVFNGRNVAAADQFIAADYVEHNLAPGHGAGLQGFKKLVTAWLAAFPDLHSTIEDLIAESDKVVVRVTGTGIQKGEFMRIPATGK